MPNQPTLFEAKTASADGERLTLHALGEFQSRGKVLAMRELALDRLRGAFKRAAEKFGVTELGDKQIAENLQRLGARVTEVPSFVAKHPFRVTVSIELAVRAKLFYEEETERGKN